MIDPTNVGLKYIFSLALYHLKTSVNKLAERPFQECSSLPSTKLAQNQLQTAVVSNQSCLDNSPLSSRLSRIRI